MLLLVKIREEVYLKKIQNLRFEEQFILKYEDKGFRTKFLNEFKNISRIFFFASPKYKDAIVKGREFKPVNLKFDQKVQIL